MGWSLWYGASFNSVKNFWTLLVLRCALEFLHMPGGLRLAADYWLPVGSAMLPRNEWRETQASSQVPAHYLKRAVPA
jgi:hypothetical protein